MKKFNWDLPADPDPKSDNYYNGIVSKELKAPSNVGEVGGRPKSVRTSFTQPSRNCHDGTSQNKRKKMLILS